MGIMCLESWRRIDGIAHGDFLLLPETTITGGTLGKLEVSFTFEGTYQRPSLPDTEVGEARLYNLANDLSETTNVIDKHPEVVTKMNQWIEQVRSDMGDWGCEGRNQRPAGIIDEPFPRLLK